MLGRSPALALLAIAAIVAAEDFSLTDEQYYEMPALFHLDEYAACKARRGLYCLGSFELLPATEHHPLYRRMQLYSANWVNNFNHTRLHRGLCVSERCPPPAPAPPLPDHELHAQWFASCVNASTMAQFQLVARPWRLEYCERGGGEAPGAPGGAARAFVGVSGALLGLAAISTLLDLTLADHYRKKWWYAVATAWCVRSNWAALRAAPAGGSLRVLDGLRVLCLMAVIIEHVAWLTTQTYLADPRHVELRRRSTDAMLMANSTLVVQIFFMMSSFLLAHKLLQQRGHQQRSALAIFAETMFNRIVRVSPSYWIVVWFAATWWERTGSGPLWAPLVHAEATICRRKWWTHLLYLNNILDADDKCLIQTWYLAADMQLYALSLALTLVLSRARRGALIVLSALLAASVALLATLAYQWQLLPTFLMHNPESVRSVYRDGRSFNVLYQSPLGNAPGALAGLLLAHLHHHLRDRGVQLQEHKWFAWASALAVPGAVWWVASSPRLAGSRAALAALAALERPVFAAIVGLALLGALGGVPSAAVSALGWRGWAGWARLCFGALLLHMPINKALVAARFTPNMLYREAVIVEWFGVAGVSFLAAIPLALLVELPAQRLARALHPPPAAAAAPSKRAPPASNAAY